jgi:hypothetical protein
MRSRAADVVVVLLGAAYCLRRWLIDDANPNLEPLGVGAVVLGPVSLAAGVVWFWGLRGRAPLVVRAVLKWILFSAACVAGVALLLNIGWGLRWRGELWNASVHDGVVEFVPSGGDGPRRSTVSGRSPGQWRWGLEYSRGPTSFQVELPLWAMVVVTAAPWAALWWVGRTRGS